MAAAPTKAIPNLDRHMISDSFGDVVDDAHLHVEGETFRKVALCGVAHLVRQGNFHIDMVLTRLGEAMDLDAHESLVDGQGLADHGECLRLRLGVDDLLYGKSFATIHRQLDWDVSFRQRATIDV